jgi:hypothetical protein
VIVILGPRLLNCAIKFYQGTGYIDVEEFNRSEIPFQPCNVMNQAPPTNITTVKHNY